MTDQNYCTLCHHPESDHVRGHCNGIKDRQALPDLDVTVLSEKYLCPCKEEFQQETRLKIAPPFLPVEA